MIDAIPSSHHLPTAKPAATNTHSLNSSESSPSLPPPLARPHALSPQGLYTLYALSRHVRLSPPTRDFSRPAEASRASETRPVNRRPSCPLYHYQFCMHRSFNPQISDTYHKSRSDKQSLHLSPQVPGQSASPRSSFPSNIGTNASRPLPSKRSRPAVAIFSRLLPPRDHLFCTHLARRLCTT